MPTLFDSNDEFSTWFSKDIESQAVANVAANQNNSTNSSAPPASLITAHLNEAQLQRLHLILKPFMLRRVKLEVEHELSEKIERTLLCELSTRQRRFYSMLRRRISTAELTGIAASLSGSSGLNSSAAASNLLNLVMQLRKVCNHPDLIQPRCTRFSCLFPDGGGGLKLSLPRLIFEQSAFLQQRSVILRHFSLFDAAFCRFPRHSLHSLHPASRKFCRLPSSTSSNSSNLKSLLDDVSHSPLRNLSVSSSFPASLQSGLPSLFLLRQNSSPNSSNLLLPELPGFCKLTLLTGHIFIPHPDQNSHHQLSSFPSPFISPSSIASSTTPTVLPEFACAAVIPRVVALPLKLIVSIPAAQHHHRNSTSSCFSPANLSSSLSPALSAPSFACFQLNPISMLIADSGKLACLDRLLASLFSAPVWPRHRVLIYSQMTRMLDLIQELLRHRRYSYVRLDGSSKLSDRRDMVAAFQSRPDIFVFLLSTRAGGLGINLTAADTVIFYDSDWNPTVDQQAMDRAHRLGQTRQVTVYRLVCRGSVEEKMVRRAQEKREMQRMVISDGGGGGGPGAVTLAVATADAEADRAEAGEAGKTGLVKVGGAQPDENNNKRNKSSSHKSSIAHLHGAAAVAAAMGINSGQSEGSGSSVLKPSEVASLLLLDE